MTDDDKHPPTIETEETTKRLRPVDELSQSIPGFRLLQKLGSAMLTRKIWEPVCGQISYQPAMHHHDLGLTGRESPSGWD